VSQQRFGELRKEYSKFVYKSYEISEVDDSIVLLYRYSIIGKSDLSFTHVLTFEKSEHFEFSALDEKFQNLVFHIGIAELISYYKITCAPIIEIEAGFIEDVQCAWFSKLFFKGLGEFLFVNQIETTQEELFTISSVSSKSAYIPIKMDKTKGSLVPVGGGKDSSVTLDILESCIDEIAGKIIGMSINPTNAAMSVMQSSTISGEPIIIRRKLDRQIIELNEVGFLNGHIPFSSIVAFISIFTAAISNLRYVVLSNENSANEANVVFNELEVNHQYSKSFEFEADFRFYCSRFLVEGIEYFSLLRPLHELQIGAMFAHLHRYFKDFRSCNVGSKNNLWCNKCSKCLFTYIMIAPFLNEDDLANIFHADLLDDDELLGTFEQLVTPELVKPLECVGSYDEVNTAVGLIIEKRKNSLPSLLRWYSDKKEIIVNPNLLKEFSTPHALPKKFEIILKERIARLTKIPKNI